MIIDVKKYLRNSSRETYTVKQGDSLYKISKQYGISIDDLMEINELDSTMIYPNQVLIISKSIPTGGMYFVEYIVKPNDTLSTIAKANNVTTESIGKYNDVTKIILAEGQIMNLPGSYKTYLIQEGDKISDILAKTNLTLDQFLEYNLSKLLTPGIIIYYR